ASSTSSATADRSAFVMAWTAQASAGSRRSGRAASNSSSTAAFPAADRVSSADLLSLTCVPPFALGRSLLNFAGRAPERGQAGRAQRAELLKGRLRVAGAQRQLQPGGQPFQGFGVVADVAVPDASLDIDPDVVGVAGASLLPQGPGLRLAPRAHQLLRQLAQHLGAPGVATAGRVADRADRVVDPAQREIAVGKILGPGPGIEPRLAFVGARQGQILSSAATRPTGLSPAFCTRSMISSMRSSRAAVGRRERRGSFFVVR